MRNLLLFLPQDTHYWLWDSNAMVHLSYLLLRAGALLLFLSGLYSSKCLEEEFSEVHLTREGCSAGVSRRVHSAKATRGNWALISKPYQRGSTLARKVAIPRSVNPTSQPNNHPEPKIAVRTVSPSRSPVVSTSRIDTSTSAVPTKAATKL